MDEEYDKFTKANAEKHCGKCACRFRVLKSRKTGDLYLDQVEEADSDTCACYDGYGWTPKGPTYEKKPVLIFDDPDFVCPGFKDAEELLAQWKIHVPNYFNEGEVPYDDEVEGTVPENA
jgi:hypothetical protein